MISSEKTLLFHIIVQGVSTFYRTQMTQINVKFLPSQFQGEKAHSNPAWDSQLGENGYLALVGAWGESG